MLLKTSSVILSLAALISSLLLADDPRRHRGDCQTCHGRHLRPVRPDHADTGRCIFSSFVSPPCPTPTPTPECRRESSHPIRDNSEEVEEYQRHHRGRKHHRGHHGDRCITSIPGTPMPCPTSTVVPCTSSSSTVVPSTTACPTTPVPTPMPTSTSIESCGCDNSSDGSHHHHHMTSSVPSQSTHTVYTSVKSSSSSSESGGDASFAEPSVKLSSGLVLCMAVVVGLWL